MIQVAGLFSHGLKEKPVMNGCILTRVTCAVGPSVTTSSTDFSFQNLVFWNFQEIA
jgi:hypothetical protein